jgi:hypothetical protein
MPSAGVFKFSHVTEIRILQRQNHNNHHRYPRVHDVCQVMRRHCRRRLRCTRSAVAGTGAGSCPGRRRHDELTHTHTAPSTRLLHAKQVPEMWGGPFVFRFTNSCDLGGGWLTAPLHRAGHMLPPWRAQPSEACTGTPPLLRASCTAYHQREWCKSCASAHRRSSLVALRLVTCGGKHRAAA